MPPEDQHYMLLQLAVDLSPAGMLVVDSRGKILLVNREIERMFGYPRNEILGRPVEMLVPDRFGAPHPTYRTHYLENPDSRPMGAGRDLSGRRKDGTEVPVEIGLNPIPTPQGMLVLGTVVDITARRAMESQLRQAQKMEAVGTLAGGIAHDFNNLLHGIVGHAELVQRRVGNDPQFREDVAQILTIAQRGRQLVERIMTFSRQRDFSRSPTRLERPVREALDLLRVSLPRTIEIRRTFDPNTPLVTCDETQIHQILVNLGTNASHAMESGGVLEVALGRFEASDASGSRSELVPGRYAHLRVSDSGSGMSAEVLERAFEPFFTTKALGKGTGLGLSMVHGIVRSLGGAIDVWSEPGKGTRIDIYLPAAGDGAGAAGSASEPASSWPHILVVEDEKDFAVMLRRQLEAFEYRATVHTSSLEALEDFRSRPHAFDALMTDNSMPRMTGLSLARELVRIRPDLPVILVSGGAATADPAELEASGVTRILKKPHTGSEMDGALREVLKRA